MAYTPTVWETGDIITAEKLNNMEGGIAANDAALTDIMSDITDLSDEIFISDTVQLESGSLDTTAGTDVVNAARLRTVKFFNLSVKKVVFSSDYYTYIFAYQPDGTYIGVYTGSGFTKNWQQQLKVYSPIDMAEILGSYDYVYRFVFIRTNGTTADKITLNLSFVMNRIDQNGNEIYTIGTSGDFQTFTAMLDALKDNTHKKIVYIYGGTYDIFNELGGATYMASVSTSGKNWRDVSKILPDNTTLIGIGDVTLAWNPTDAQIIDDAHARLFSPLNLSGNCTIKNITIRCSNCRYGIHDETSGKAVYNGVEHVFEDVTVIYTKSTYGIKYAYGAGHNKNSKYKYKNCLFSAGFGASWSMHDWSGGAAENSTFDIDNCIFWNNETNAPCTVRFSSSDTVGRLDKVTINGSVFSELQFSTEGSTAIKQGYEATTMLCKSYTVAYSSYIANADRIAPKAYLTIS